MHQKFDGLFAGLLASGTETAAAATEEEVTEHPHKVFDVVHSKKEECALVVAQTVKIPSASYLR